MQFHFLNIPESHICEDVHRLLLAIGRSDRAGLQEAAMAVKGRCARLAHMVKTEIRENPVRYSKDNIQTLNEAVRKLESKCMGSITLLCICIIILPS